MLITQREVCRVVLVEVVVQVSEDAEAGFLIGENESAEIAVEGLYTGARGDKIVVVTQVLQLHLDECLLQTEMRIQPRVALAYVDVDDAVFLGMDVVDVYLGREFNSPVHWPERGVAVEEVEGKGQVLAHEVLAKSSEKLLAIGTLGTKTAGNRQSPAIDEGVAG